MHGGSIILLDVFPAMTGGELFIICILYCLTVALITVFFNPFFINLVWSITLQIKLLGKR
ncbi:hypothetical protein DQ961_13755 [Salmonella bongori]|nr:hypothetical protein [Salmonella bongori]